MYSLSYLIMDLSNPEVEEQGVHWTISGQKDIYFFHMSTKLMEPILGEIV